MRLKTKLFTLRLPLDLIEKLDLNKRKIGASKTFQIIQALREYFSKSEKDSGVLKDDGRN